MSKTNMRDNYLRSFNLEVNGGGYYLSDKYQYKMEMLDKCAVICGTQYLATDPVRNSAHFEETAKNARRAFVKEKNSVMQNVMDSDDSDVNVVHTMYPQVANGFLALFSDFVKLFVKTPISEEQYEKICKFAGQYSTNTYNEISKMQADYCSSVDTIMCSAATSLKNYKVQTQAQFDAAPQFGTFFGNVQNDMFGNTHVYGRVYTDNSSRRAEQYMAASQNKVTVEYEKKTVLRN